MERQTTSKVVRLERELREARRLARETSSLLLVHLISDFQYNLLIRRGANLWIDEATFEHFLCNPEAFDDGLDARLRDLMWEDNKLGEFSVGLSMHGSQYSLSLRNRINGALLKVQPHRNPFTQIELLQEGSSSPVQNTALQFIRQLRVKKDIRADLENAQAVIYIATNLATDKQIYIGR